MIADETRCRLLIVDDDPIVRRAFRLALHGETITVVGEASDGVDALLLLETHRNLIDVVLLDVRMPTMSGIATVNPIRVRFPAVRIVLTTSFLDDSLSAHISNMGAHGFVAKSAPIDDFTRAILGDQRRSEEPPGVIETTLTTRERSVAALVAEGYSNSGIAAVLGLSVNTVKTYTSRIFAKLGVRNRVQLANRVSLGQNRVPPLVDGRARDGDRAGSGV
ncbi:DNA-binding response regulator [Leifsonia sp. LS1]|uniref:response regulator transcription factor n=1 Tax=Leifsonia sp. LS1 TaxID=2828483 RepID=UPI001CFEBF61|nr:response regulator transcription factor [Leifsonia sp. LS1]GIT80769.1 DNA-binding response regulator [Leifsonia sp. LS1]